MNLPNTLRTIVQPLLLVLFSSSLLAQSRISAFSPASGPVGTTVTISGNYFNARPDSNIVWFGGVRAQVLTATTASLTVRVPNGATFEPLSVLNQSTRQIEFSNTAFRTTYSLGAIAQTVINGSASKAASYATDYSPFEVHLADMDGDGRPELVVNTGEAASILRNTTVPGGSFNTTSFASYINLWNNTGAANIALRDLDGDGRLDVLCASSTNTYHARIYLNQSTAGHLAFGTGLT